MHLQPYLFFAGRCEEALEFYRGALGAQVTALLRWKDGPEAAPGLPPGWESKVMHAELRVGDTTVLASDGSGQGGPAFEGFSLALTAASDAETDRLFAALSKGGQVRQPLTQTFFTSRFGVVVDRFGVGWMVLTESPPQA